MSSSNGAHPSFNSQNDMSGQFNDGSCDSDKYTPDAHPEAPRTTRSVSNTRRVDFTPSTTKHIKFATPTPDRVSSSSSNVQTVKAKSAAPLEKSAAPPTKRSKKKKCGAYARFMRDAFRTKRSHKDKRRELEHKIMKGKLVVGKQRDRL